MLPIFTALKLQIVITGKSRLWKHNKKMLKNSELGEKAVLKRSTRVRRLSEHLSNINQLKIAKQNEKL